MNGLGCLLLWASPPGVRIVVASDSRCKQGVRQGKITKNGTFSAT